jgi:opacity protein-like surface antigen
MQVLTPRSSVPFKRPLLAAAIATIGCSAWAAEDGASPYYIGVSQAVMHDSNVYRVPDAQRIADYYSSTGLLAGLDQTISRQRVYASANVNYNKFRNEDALNNTSYAVKAGWDWATIEKLSGTFSGSANRSLASQDGNASIPVTKRNIANTDQLAASIRWGGEGLLTLEGNYQHSRVRYSAPEYISEESSGDTGSAGIFYRVGPTLRIGLAGRYTHTEAPYAIATVAVPTGPGDYQAEKSNGRNVDLTADWRYSEQTNVNARLSWTRQTFSGIQERNFSGLTGAIYANYAPTGKLTFNASFVRDAGINPTFFNVVGAPSTAPNIGLSENSEVVNTAGIGVRYAATAKITANAKYQYRHAKIANTVGVAGATTTSEESDNLRIASLGITYDITRAWQVSCDIAHETRDISGTSGFSYSANVGGCAVQFVYR